MKSTRWLKHFHAIMTVLWFILIPLTIFSALKQSIVWIALMSVWANFVGHFSSWQSTRIESKQDDNDNGSETTGWRRRR